MFSLHQAIGFADVSSLEAPASIYLGNDKGACNTAIDAAIKSGKYQRIVRQDHFYGNLRKVGLQAAQAVRTECGPEANARHLQALAENSDPAKDKAKRDADLAKRQAHVDELRQARKKEADAAAAAAAETKAAEEKASAEAETRAAKPGKQKKTK